METEEQKRQRVQEAILRRLTSAQDDTSEIDQAAADDKRKKIVMAIGQGLSGLATADSASRGGYKSDSGFYDTLAANVNSKGGAEKAKRDKVQSIIQEQALRSKFGDEDFDRLKFKTSGEQFDNKLRQDDAQFKDTQKLSREKLAADGVASSNASVKAPPMDPGEVAHRRKLGSDAAEWKKSGRVAFTTNLNLLKKGRDELRARHQLKPGQAAQKNPGMVGAIGGYLTKKFPDAAAVVDPQQAVIRKNIETAVQGTLKPILGAQFAQKEGERILSNAYDPILSGYNIERIDEAIKHIEEMAQGQEAAFSEFNVRGGGLHPDIDPVDVKQVDDYSGETTISPSPARQRLELLRKKKAGN